MTTHTHGQMVNFIWGICNLLRGPYKRNEYRKVILPMTILRRFDCILEPTKEKALAEHAKLKGKSEAILAARLRAVTGVPFHNLSKLTFTRLLDDPDRIAAHLTAYVNAFSPDVRQIFERLGFAAQIERLHQKNLLYNVVKAFASPEIDLSPEAIDNLQMGYVFEELIRIGAEQANEEAGEHFTPREVIRLMVNLLLSPEADLGKSHIVKKIYDPACGTGGMLSVAEEYIKSLNAEAEPFLYGQDWNDEAYAICRADMLIKGEDAERIKPDCTFERDGFAGERFDYMLANPPFGVEWKQQEKTIRAEHKRLGYDGRFGAGLPRINDGSLLFLQHMLSKMRAPGEGGSRIAIVFNGSPLFTGDAGSGESSIRQWIIENDWLEAIVALPDQLFYNTGISTYIWILTNRKEPRRKGKVQLIDARQYSVKMRKSLGNKRNRIGDGEEGTPDQIAAITKLYGNAKHEEQQKFEIDGEKKSLVVSKIFKNEDFGYRKVTVERPLRLNFRADAERLARLEEAAAFRSLAASKKKNGKQHQAEIAAGEARQEEIRTLLRALGKSSGETPCRDRDEFLTLLKKQEAAQDIRLSGPERKAILEALSERDPEAEVCRDGKGNPEPDASLRDTENIPLSEEVEAYFHREVLPHVPDAWIDDSKTKIGYEIPLNRHFYRYEPPRPLEAIEAEIRGLEQEIVSMLAEVTGSGEGK